MAYVSGVRYGGIQSEPPTPFKSYDANAPEEVAKRKAFAASPKGRLHRAISVIEQTHPVAGYNLRGLYCRSVQMSDEPMTREVGGAFVAILNGVEGEAAKAALDAVADLLMALTEPQARRL